MGGGGGTSELLEHWSLSCVTFLDIEALLGGRQGGMYVPSLNFKYGHFAL